MQILSLNFLQHRWRVATDRVVLESFECCIDVQLLDILVNT